MREIKFRAIRKGSNEFLHGDLVHNCQGDAIFPNVIDEHALMFSPDYYTIDPETIGQFTGLTDRNGKEIYEGDVLSLEEKFHYQVVFNNAQFECVHAAKSNSMSGVLWGPLYKMFEPSILNYGEFEVIGNIHQNPELL